MLADLPLGWTQQGTVELGDNSGGTSPISSFDDTGLGGCLGVATPEPVKAAEATSPEFADNGVSLLVDNWADVYPTAAGAASDFPAVGNPKFPACFVQEFARETTDWIKAYFEQDVTVGTLSPSVRNLGSYGDQSGVLEIFTPLTFPDGTTQTEYVDFLFVREGRSLGTIILDNSDAPFPAAIEQSLAQTITAKMAHAST